MSSSAGPFKLERKKCFPLSDNLMKVYPGQRAQKNEFSITGSAQPEEL